MSASVAFLLRVDAHLAHRGRTFVTKHPDRHAPEIDEPCRRKPIR